MTGIALPPLPGIILDPVVTLALAEDLGCAGDITTDATIAIDLCLQACIRTRADGILAGLDVVTHTMKTVDHTVIMETGYTDGDRIFAGDTVACISGRARSILMAERVMLNFLGRLSGIATLTRAFVDKIAHTPAMITCTRKTLPGHRALEKHAVRCGGGLPHRYGLYDAILIKDNHIAANDSISKTMAQAKARAGHSCTIGIEVDTLDQLAEALACKPHAVLLDNMNTSQLRQAVRMIDGQCFSEASGGITLNNVSEKAETGVNYLSSGALTQSVESLDFGLDID